MRLSFKILFFSMVFLFMLSAMGPTAFAESDKNKDTVIGDLTDFSKDGNKYTLKAGDEKVRVMFYKNDLFRIWLAEDGKFTDPTDEEMIAKDDFEEPKTEWKDEGDYYQIDTEDVTLRIYKEPLRFELYESDNKTSIWKEKEGLSWDDDGTKQTLEHGDEEQFFGGGMQNGRFTHRDESIDITADNDWEDGGNSSAAPFYMSSNGYGVFRNTFEPGKYSFKDPVKTVHYENRFDSFYFYGPDLKDILDGYTELTGRPFMPPLYGLEPGDSDCYNDDGRTTTDALDVADGYKEYDMPAGWLLVNDGYGCGYEDLEETGSELRDHNMELGLWTEDGLPDQKYEVEDAGVRVRKLDVAWIGSGYDYALNGAKEAYEGIEENSDARGYVWMVDGWSGAQRYAVQWTGDQAGSWENIRFHIPTIAGSGLSGQAYTTGDIDGIFEGSAETYTRDLQWKVFNPVLMSMSGWADGDKQPWRYGEPYTSINRKYLKLRQQLMPYIYTYAAEAHENGTPLARSMVLEYPDDPVTWDETTKYQYLFGESMLVAPVFEDSDKRDGIYLPEGKWIDYWSGDVYNGPQMVNDYEAPLDKLPLFVKAGAIVPMWPENNSYKELDDDHPMLVDIYPEGEESFDLYEDDGETRDYQDGDSATQTIKTDSPENGSGDINITVGKSDGEYDGKPESRSYEFNVHTSDEPKNVNLDDEVDLTAYDSKEEWEDADAGWYFDEDNENGMVHVKADDVSLDESFNLTLEDSSSVGQDQGNPAALLQLDAPEDVDVGETFDVTPKFKNGSSKKMEDVELSMDLPDEWEIEDAEDATFQEVDKEEEVTSTFSITVPEDAEEDNYDIPANAVYEQTGEDYSANAYTEVSVADPYKVKQSEMEASATSEEDGSGEAENAIDGKEDTMWHTDFSGDDKLPQSIKLDLGDTRTINKIFYLPRQTGTNGIITKYKLYASTDGKDFEEITSGEWENNKKEKKITFDPVDANYMKLEAEEGVGGFASAADINVFAPEPDDMSVSILRDTLEDYRDDIDSEDAFHLSDVHLQAVERYEDQEKKEKVVKHLKGFKEMLDKQQDEEMISDEAFDHLQEQTDLLIAKWK